MYTGTALLETAFHRIDKHLAKKLFFLSINLNFKTPGLALRLLNLQPSLTNNLQVTKGKIVKRTKYLQMKEWKN